MNKNSHLIAVLISAQFAIHAANIVYDDYSGTNNAIADGGQTNTGQSGNGSSNFIISSDQLTSSATSSGHYLSINLDEDYLDSNPEVYELSASVDYGVSI